jgi:hypothetical protein
MIIPTMKARAIATVKLELTKCMIQFSQRRLRAGCRVNIRLQGQEITRYKPGWRDEGTEWGTEREPAEKAILRGRLFPYW